MSLPLILSGCSAGSSGSGGGSETPESPTREALFRFQNNLSDSAIYRTRPVAAAPNESGELTIESDPLALNYNIRLQYLDTTSSPPLFRPIDAYVLEYSETDGHESIFHGYDAQDQFVPVYLQGLSSEIQPLLNQLFEQNFGSSSLALLPKTTITPQAGTRPLTFSLPTKRNAPNFDATLLFEETDVTLSDYQTRIEASATERTLDALSTRMASSAIEIKSIFVHFNELNQPSNAEPDGQITAYNFLIEDNTDNTRALIKAFLQDKLHTVWNSNASSVFVVERTESSHTVEKNKVLYEIFESNPNLTRPNLTLTNPDGHRLDWTTVTFADFFNIYRAVRTPQGVVIRDVIRDVQPPHTIPQSQLRDGFTYTYEVAAQNKSNLGPKSGAQSLSFTVINDQNPIVQFAKQTDSTAEDSQTIKVDLFVNTPPTENQTITLRTSGTATLGLDYQLVNAAGTVLDSPTTVLGEFQTTTSIFIRVLTDQVDESVETVILTLDTVDDMVIGDQSQYTLSIAELPNVIIDNPPTSILTTRTITVDFSLDDDSVPVHLESVLIPAGESADPFSAVNGTSQTLTDIADGTYTLQVRAFDNSGVRGIISEMTFTVDATAPTLFIQGPLSPTKDRTATLSFTANESVTFEGKLNNLTDFQTITSPWVVSVAEGEIFENRTNTAEIRATDTAGNETTETVTWTIDTLPPTLEILTRPQTPTQDQEIEVQFRSEDGATIEASLNGEDFHTVSSPYLTNETIEGDNSLRLRATDALGNVSAIQTISWELISVGPAITVITPPPADTRNRTVTFSIQTEVDNATVQSALRKDGSTVAQQPTIIDLAANKKLLTFFNLADGDYDLLLTAFNSARFSGPPKSLSWTVDTAAPSITFDNPETLPETLSVVRNARFELDAEAGLQFEFGFATGNRRTGSYDDIEFVRNRARLIQYVMNEDGDYIFKARGIDPAGNIGEFISHEWTIDTLEPTIEFVTVPPQRSGISTQRFSVASNKPVTFLYKLHTEADFRESQNSEILLENLENRNYTLFVKAKDSANRESEIINTQFLIASLGPRTFITAQPDSLTNQTAAVFTYESSTQTTFQYKLIGDSSGTVIPFSPTTNRQVTLNLLTDDTYTFLVKAFDSEGNEGPIEQTSFRLDTTPPTLSITQELEIYDRELPLAFNVTDNSDIELRVTVDQTTTLTASASPPFDTSIPVRNDIFLSEGSHSFVAHAIDAAGNESDPITYQWETSFTPPTARFVQTPDAISNVPRPTFVITAELGALTAFSLDSDSPSDFTLNAIPLEGSGTRILAFSQDLPDGEHTLYIKAKYPNRPFGPIASHTWRVQTNTPRLTVSNPPATYSNEENPLITFVSDVGVHFDYSLKSDEETHSAESLSEDDFQRIPLNGNAIILPSLDSGHLYTLYGRTIDAVGTTSDVLITTWNVDLEAPVVQFSETPNRIDSLNTAQFTVNQLNGDDIEKILFKLDNRSNYLEQESLTLNFAGLSNGQHTLWVKAVDRAGNVSQILTYDWTVDRSQPILTFETQPDRYSNDGSPSFEIEANSVIDHFTYSLVSPNDPDAIEDEDGRFTLSLDREATYTLYVTAYKGFTRSETITANWTFDRTTPVLNITQRPTERLRESSATLAFEFQDPQEVATVKAVVNDQLFTPITSPFTIASIIEGNNTLRISATDRAGNKSPTQTIQYIGDQTPPTTTLLTPETAPAQLTNKTTATFNIQSSEVDASLTFRLENNGVTIGNPVPTVTNHGNNHLTIVYSNLQPQATAYTFTAFSTDTLGNQESPGLQHTWTIDANAIDMRFNERVAILPTVSNQSQQQFSILTDATQLSYELDGEAAVSIQNPTFTVPNTGVLSEGSHEIVITGEDDLSNESSIRHTWTVDTTAPDTSLTTSPLSVTTSREATFGYSADETPVTFFGRLDDGVYTQLPDNQVQFTQLSEGRHKFEVKSIDAAGNEDESPVEYNWIIDRSNPTVQILSGPSEFTNQRSGRVEFISSDEEAQFFIQFSYETAQTTQFIEITNDVALIGNTFTYFLPRTHLIQNDTHTITLKARDAAGNETDTPATYSWTIDTIAPLPTYTQLTPGVHNESRASFTLGTSPSEPATFQFRLYEQGDNNKNSLPFRDTPSSFTISDINDGLYQIDYRATDRAGNSGNFRSSRVFEIDTTGPTVSTITLPRLSNQNEVTLTLSVTPLEPDVTFQYRHNRGTFETLENNILTLTNLSQGNQILDVRAIDSANNIGPIQTVLWDTDLGEPRLTQLVFTPENNQVILNNQIFTRDTAGTIRLSGNNDAHDFFGALDVSEIEPLGNYDALNQQRQITLSNLTEGNHVYRAYTTDEAGNTSNVLSTNWTVDLSAPELSITAAESISTNRLAVTLSTTDETAVIFDAKPNLIGADFETVQAQTSFDNLAEGQHTFIFRATDHVGNVSETQTHTVFVDMTPPVLHRIGEAPISNLTFFEVVFSSNEARPFFFSIDDEDPNTFQPSTQLLATALGEDPDRSGFNLTRYRFTADDLNYDSQSDQSFTIRTFTEDALGNQSETSDFTARLDRIQPDTRFLGVPDAASIVNTVIAVVGTNEEDVTSYNFTLLQDGAPFSHPFTTQSNGVEPAAQSITLTQLPPNHDYELRAAAIDPAGNADSTPASIPFRIDRIAPTLEIVEGPATDVVTTERQPSFTLQYTEDSVRLDYILDGVASFVQTDSLVNNIFQVPSQLENGQHEIVFIVRDAANNGSNEVRHSWQIDASTPVLRFDPDPVLNPHASQFQFTASSSRVINVINYNVVGDGQTLTQNTVTPEAPSEQFTITLDQVEDGLLNRSPMTLSVTVTDALDRTSDTLNITWETDTTAPQHSIVGELPDSPIPVQTLPVNVQTTKQGTLFYMLRTSQVAIEHLPLRTGWTSVPLTEDNRLEILSVPLTEHDTDYFLYIKTADLNNQESTATEHQISTTEAFVPYTVGFDRNRVTITEPLSDEELLLTLTLSREAETELTLPIRFNFRESTADKTEDATFEEQQNILTFTFEEGASTATKAVTIHPDDLQEGNELLRFEIGDLRNSLVFRNGAISVSDIVIFDDDNSSLVRFSAISETIDLPEEGSFFDVRILRTVPIGSRARAFTVNLNSTESTAILGQDFELTRSDTGADLIAEAPIYFSEDKLESFTIRVTPINDEQFEADKTIRLKLEIDAQQPVTLTPINDLTVNLINDDLPLASVENVTVQNSINGTYLTWDLDPSQVFTHYDLWRSTELITTENPGTRVATIPSNQSSYFDQADLEDPSSFFIDSTRYIYNLRRVDSNANQSRIQSDGIIIYRNPAPVFQTTDIEQLSAGGFITDQLSSSQLLNTIIVTDASQNPVSQATEVVRLTLLNPDDVGAFSLDPGTGRLFLTDPSDINNTESPAITVNDSRLTFIHELSVRATDTHGETTDQTVRVHFRSQNDAPVFTDGTTLTVAETAAVDTVIGDIGVTDPDAPFSYETLTFEILSGNDDGHFRIDAENKRGFLVVDGALDFETTTSYRLEIRATDSDGSTATGFVSVQVTNVNEPPTLRLASQSINENTAETTAFRFGSRIPIEANTGHTLTYDPEGDNYSVRIVSVEANAFRLQSNQLLVRTPSALDFERNAAHTLTVELEFEYTQDAVVQRHRETFTINLNDVEEGPVFNDRSYLIDSHSYGPGVIIGTLGATDPEDDPITYTLNGTSDLFEIHARRPEIVFKNLASPPDQIAEDTYDLNITAESQGLTDTAVMSVIVVHRETITNEFSITEGTRAGNLLGTITFPSGFSATDIVSTTGNEDGFFSISDQGSLSLVRTLSIIPRPSSTSRILTIDPNAVYVGNTYLLQLSLQNSASQTGRVTIAINVTPSQIDSSPIISDSSMTYNDVTDELILGEEVANSSSDPLRIPLEDPQGLTLTSQLNTLNADDIFSYTQVGNEGRLSIINHGLLNDDTYPFIEKIDNETYIVTLQIGVTNSDALSSTGLVTLTVTTPLRVPEAAQNQTATVSELASIGTEIKLIGATDINQTQSDNLTYTITGPLANGPFEINNLGIVSLSQALDFETLSQYIVPISFTDETGLTGTTELTVTVTDQPEAPIIENQSFDVIQNTPAGTFIGYVHAEPIGADTISIHIQDGVEHFEVDTQTGALSVSSTVDLEIGEHTYILFANSTGQFNNATLRINVIDGTPPDPPQETQQLPRSTNTIFTVDEDTLYTVRINRIPYSDPNNDPLDHIRIRQLPRSGTLFLNGQPITPLQKISATHLAQGRFTYLPNSNVNGIHYFDAIFRVYDGPDDSNGADFSHFMGFNIIPINDPVTIQPLDAITLSSLTPEGSTIATATGGDNPDNVGLRFSIISGNDDGIFTAILRTGEIKVLDNSELTHGDTHTLTIQMIDDYGTTTTTTLQITVEDPTEITGGITALTLPNRITSSFLTSTLDFDTILNFEKNNENATQRLRVITQYNSFDSSQENLDGDGFFSVGPVKQLRFNRDDTQFDEITLTLVTELGDQKTTDNYTFYLFSRNLLTAASNTDADFIVIPPAEQTVSSLYRPRDEVYYHYFANNQERIQNLRVTSIYNFETLHADPSFQTAQSLEADPTSSEGSLFAVTETTQTDTEDDDSNFVSRQFSRRFESSNSDRDLPAGESNLFDTTLQYIASEHLSIATDLDVDAVFDRQYSYTAQLSISDVRGHDGEVIANPTVVFFDPSEQTFIKNTNSYTLLVGPNQAPVSPLETTEITVDTALTALTIGNFSYQDAEGAPLDQVRIRSLPNHGRLLLNDAPVALNDRIASADITAGRLKFNSLLQDGQEEVNGITSITYRVWDPIQESAENAFLQITIDTDFVPARDILLSDNIVIDNEDTSTHLEIGTLTAIDENDDETHTFSIITGEDSGSFLIIENTLYFQSGTSLDNAVKNQYHVNVTAEDNHGFTSNPIRLTIHVDGAGPLATTVTSALPEVYTLDNAGNAFQKNLQASFSSTRHNASLSAQVNGVSVLVNQSTGAFTADLEINAPADIALNTLEMSAAVDGESATAIRTVYSLSPDLTTLLNANRTNELFAVLPIYQDNRIGSPSTFSDRGDVITLDILAQTENPLEQTVLTVQYDPRRYTHIEDQAILGVQTNNPTTPRFTASFQNAEPFNNDVHTLRITLDEREDYQQTARSVYRLIQLSFEVKVPDGQLQLTQKHDTDFTVRHVSSSDGQETLFSQDPIVFDHRFANIGIRRTHLELSVGPNNLPASNPSNIAMRVDRSQVITTAHFAYSDADSDPLSHVKITQLPADGQLTLNGVPVILNQEISATAIANNQLVYTAASTPPASGFVRLNFQVSDGLAFSTVSGFNIFVRTEEQLPTLNTPDFIIPNDIGDSSTIGLVVHENFDPTTLSFTLSSSQHFEVLANGTLQTKASVSGPIPAGDYTLTVTVRDHLDELTEDVTITVDPLTHFDTSITELASNPISGSLADITQTYDNNFVVISTHNNQTTVYFSDSDGDFRDSTQTLQGNADQLTVRRNDNPLISFPGNNKVIEYNRDNFSIETQFTVASPRGVAVHDNGITFIASQSGNQIELFNTLGSRIRTITGLSQPIHIAFDSNGFLYVSEKDSTTLKRFQNSANTHDWEAAGTITLADIGRIGDLNIRPDDTLWITDSTNNQVKQFQLSGQLATTFGYTTAGSGSHLFDAPTGIAVNDLGKVLILDNGNSRIKRYGTDNTFAALTPPPAPTIFQADTLITEFDNNYSMTNQFSWGGNYALLLKDQQSLVNFKMYRKIASDSDYQAVISNINAGRSGQNDFTSSTLRLDTLYHYYIAAVVREADGTIHESKPTMVIELLGNYLVGPYVTDPQQPRHLINLSQTNTIQASDTLSLESAQGAPVELIQNANNQWVIALEDGETLDPQREYQIVISSRKSNDFTIRKRFYYNLNFNAIQTPPLITGLTYNIQDSQAELTWDGVTDRAEYKFEVLRSVSGQDNFVSVGQDITTTSFDDTTVQSGVSYDYRVRYKIGGIIDGPQSSVQTITIP